MITTSLRLRECRGDLRQSEPEDVPETEKEERSEVILLLVSWIH